MPILGTLGRRPLGAVFPSSPSGKRFVNTPQAVLSAAPVLPAGAAARSLGKTDHRMSDERFGDRSCTGRDLLGRRLDAYSSGGGRRWCEKRDVCRGPVGLLAALGIRIFAGERAAFIDITACKEIYVFNVNLTRHTPLSFQQGRKEMDCQAAR